MAVGAQLSTAFLTFYGVQEYSASCQANRQGEYAEIKSCPAAADWFRVRLTVRLPVNSRRSLLLWYLLQTISLTGSLSTAAGGHFIFGSFYFLDNEPDGKPGGRTFYFFGIYN